MFSAARCPLPLHPQPHAGIPCPRPSTRARPRTTVSAAPRRRGTRDPRRGSSWDDGNGDSDSDDRIDADFFGPEHDDNDEEEEDEAPPPTRTASPQTQLRGTDVLRALQRAAAAKEAKKKKDKKPAPRQGQGKQKEKLKAGGEVAVDGEVRPVVVKPEWAARIRELELRVQQLADRNDESSNIFER